MNAVKKYLTTGVQPTFPPAPVTTKASTPPPFSTQDPQPPLVSTQAPPPVTTNPGGGGAGGQCKATGAWTGNANMDAWCVSNCAVGNCPSSMCKCD